MFTMIQAVNQWLANKAPAIKYVIALLATGGAIGTAIVGQWASTAGFLAVAGGAVTSAATIKTNNLASGTIPTPKP